MRLLRQCPTTVEDVTITLLVSGCRMDSSAQTMMDVPWAAIGEELCKRRNIHSVTLMLRPFPATAKQPRWIGGGLEEVLWSMLEFTHEIGE